ncbi:hypothetical protein FGIG_02133 [Fasciola gigantica]|uniref:Uncharacterized protein n=1 Tax=Fasciola gigantica TaxID=46835 RepID=A0A504YK12_FASGI|nr:hypothetical protein FGIG_02133 [Fasciola gigantica]
MVPLSGPESVVADNESIQSTTEIIRNDVTHFSDTISDSTTTEYNGATWNRKFLIWTILSSVMLCYQ